LAPTFSASNLETEPMNERADALERVLSASSDHDNPGAEELRELMGRPLRIAVVGLSRFPEKPARRVPAYLAAQGHDVVPVNPSAERIMGRPAYATLAEVPGEVDLVMIYRPSAQAGAFVAQALARPERPAIWLSEGIRADAQIAEARGEGLTAVQDLCAYKVHVALQDGRALSRGGPPATDPRGPSR
jgi:predicted CoA-binding protein